ncbi:MAG: tautomerase family protein [Bacillota bacterium]|nr:tautomerase family protein [Bacillota bacterium]
MAQVKIYGIHENLNKVKNKLSEVIHSCAVDALKLPQDKRFHRFFPLATEDFFYPEGRTEKYIIIEISMFEGRSIEANKLLIKLLFERIEKELEIRKNDVEITIFETPKCNWGIRGVTGDELELNYKLV